MPNVKKLFEKMVEAGERDRADMRTRYFDNDVKIDHKTLERVTPCPFCGIRPEVTTSGEGSRGLMIHCIADNCPNPSVSYYDHETALAVWNQRDGRHRASRPREGA